MAIKISWTGAALVAAVTFTIAGSPGARADLVNGDFEYGEPGGSENDHSDASVNPGDGSRPSQITKSKSGAMGSRAFQHTPETISSN